MTPLNHQLFGVVAAIVLLGIFGLVAAFLERTLSEAERPPEPIDLIPYGVTGLSRTEYAALLTFLRRMREEAKREGDRDPRSPVPHSAR